MTTTNHLALTLVDSAQAQKEVTVNAALARIDAVLNAGAKDKDLATAPGSPSAGDVYIVAASPTGAWSGQAKAVAYYDQSWKFIAPNEGMTLWVNDENMLYSYDGSVWTASTSFQSVSLLGVNATADSTNKLAVASSAALFDNIGNGMQVKVNKHAASDTGSFLYQTNYSGHAEIGLCGDDNFHFKVSPDGSTWYDAIVIDKSTGNVTLGYQSNVARALSVQTGGDTNTSGSGSGAYFYHNLTYTLPASYLTAAKVLRITAMLTLSTGTTGPSFLIALNAGSTAIYTEISATAPGNSVSTRSLLIAWEVYGTAAAGASAATLTAAMVQPNGSGAPANATVQPVNLATNGTLQFKIGTQWLTAGSNDAAITLNAFKVEALN